MSAESRVSPPLTLQGAEEGGGVAGDVADAGGRALAQLVALAVARLPAHGSIPSLGDRGCRTGEFPQKGLWRVCCVYRVPV